MYIYVFHHVKNKIAIFEFEFSSILAKCLFKYIIFRDIMSTINVDYAFKCKKAI